MPRVSVVIKYATQNQSVSGVFVLSRAARTSARSGAGTPHTLLPPLSHHGVSALMATPRARKTIRPATCGQIPLTGFFPCKIKLKLT